MLGTDTTRSVVVEFHDSSVNIREFEEQMGLQYVGTVGPLEWAHEFKFTETGSSTGKRSLLWDNVLETLENLKVEPEHRMHSTFFEYSSARTLLKFLRFEERPPKLSEMV